MALTVGMYHFICRDALSLATFWFSVLELPVDEGATGQLAMIDFDTEATPTWIFQAGPDELPSGHNRVAFDLTSEDWQQQAARLESLGATRIGEYEVGHTRWIELLDIESNLLRLFAPRRG